MEVTATQPTSPEQKKSVSITRQLRIGQDDYARAVNLIAAEIAKANNGVIPPACGDYKAHALAIGWDSPALNEAHPWLLGTNTQLDLSFFVQANGTTLTSSNNGDSTKIYGAGLYEIPSGKFLTGVKNFDENEQKTVGVAAVMEVDGQLVAAVSPYTMTARRNYFGVSLHIEGVHFTTSAEAEAIGRSACAQATRYTQRTCFALASN